MRFLITFTYLITGIFTFCIIHETQFHHWNPVKNDADSLYYPAYKIVTGYLTLISAVFAVNQRARIAASQGLICLLALSGWWLEAIGKPDIFNLTPFRFVNISLWGLAIAGYLGAIGLSLKFIFTGWESLAEAR